MKNIVLFILMMLPVAVFGQKDITTFLGIPVDGTKNAMINKLTQKGFKKAAPGKTYDLIGEFNGEDVQLTIVTYKNKVWRIMVSDKNPCSEIDVRIRFNRLVDQFSKSDKYVTANFKEADSYFLDEDEDISSGISLFHKRYEAVFYQQPDISLIDTLKVQNEIKSKLIRKFGEQRVLHADEDVKNEAVKESLYYFADIINKKSVWFMISGIGYNKYSINLYYDNEYNHTTDSDL